MLGRTICEELLDFEVVATDLANLPQMPHWKDALAEFMNREFHK